MGRLLWSLLLLAGCDDLFRGSPAEQQDPASELSEPHLDVERVPGTTEVGVTVSPRQPEEGAELIFEATGLPPNAEVEIGVGPPASEYEVVSQGYVEPSGFVRGQVELPDWASPGGTYVIVVAVPDGPKAVSAPFQVEQAG